MRPERAAIQMPEGCHEVLLHACCAPCSSAIVEWLVQHGVRTTIFYYNPNIWPREEYDIRKNESKRHAERLGVQWIDGDYDHELWRQSICGLENEPERGRRCEQCFTLRLTAAAAMASRLGIRHFATTLASSRWKSLEQIERAGQRAQEAMPGTTFWAQNWRKGGLQERRNQLLREFGFYNQQYCGCEYSVRGTQPTKALLRQQIRAARQQYAPQMQQWSEQTTALLADRLLPCTAQQPAPPVCRMVLAYWPLPDEVDIRPLLDRLVMSGVTVLLPKVTGTETMEVRRYTSRADMQQGAFHIMEPTGPLFTGHAGIDVALVPGVAFDAAGHRLGRGRGYYDRFLSSLTATRKTGVCFPFQLVPVVPTDAHDVSMDEVLVV